MKFVYIFLNAFLLTYAATEDWLRQIEKGIDQLAFNNTKAPYLQNAIDNIFQTTRGTPETSKAVCDMCVILTNAALKLRKNGATRETAQQFGESLCMWFVGKTKAFCTRYVDVELDVVLYIIDKKPELTAEHFCAIRLQEVGCTEIQKSTWSVSIPPKVADTKPAVKREVNEDLVVHLTDVHYDPLYEPGANTKCEFSVCCQNTLGKASNIKEGAGYWGDYAVCDTPLHAIKDLLKQVVKQHPKIDRVYFTGDIVNHQIGGANRETNTRAITTILNEFKAAFKSIPVYPVLGNHESYPSDFYSPINITDGNISSQWILDLVAEEWMKWLPLETQPTIRKGGYYTVLVKPGFRIIGLNSNLCYTYNLWLVYDDKDPHDQLQWLVETLAAAEKNNEVVHIISHVPAGDKTFLRQCNHEYRRIVDRFANTIAGQFNGHTHNVELRVFYDLQSSKRVVNTAFVGGSFTSFVGYNPNYRVYNVDSSSWLVNDYHEWTYNLQEANKCQDEAPKWFKFYSLKDAYGLDDLHLDSYDKLLQKMAGNSSWIEKYRRLKVRDSSVLLSHACDKYCMADLYCSITNVEFEDSPQCQDFKRKL